ncbi:hypothetical protein [Rheinheimera maricola]|uniref:Uncharacterized protein n=1 Tax=Rheinheimera maricola TaxID=2793282 RepID=A0ABS7X7J9_9GAMM|nr:hypothetical protein [Rheinheimera maricola]MBZ9611523.1 hypothetical protein [Rheinheimera maricola]
MNQANQQEWLLLQRSFASYDKQAIWLKIVAVATWLCLLQSTAGLQLQLVAIGLFWLHEIMLRVVQQRTAERLLQLEQANAQQSEIAMQWHTLWQSQRGGVAKLLSDYAIQLIKPSVAISYISLIILSLAKYFRF